MDNREQFVNQSMDEIVFDQRNKHYGAYVLRRTYQKHLLKAIVISFGLFAFGLYTPKVANALGLLKKDIPDTLESTIIDIRELETELPRDPVIEDPKPETEFNQEKFAELTAVPKDQSEDPNIVNDKLNNIGNTTITNKDSASHVTIIMEDPVIPDEPKEIKPVIEVDQKAQFIGGPEVFKKFLDDNIIYPKRALDDMIEGTAIVIFVVSLDGEVSDVRIQRSSGSSELDEEAKRVIRKASSMFRPGKVKGKPVVSYCSIPIGFALETDEDE